MTLSRPIVMAGLDPAIYRRTAVTQIGETSPTMTSGKVNLSAA